MDQANGSSRLLLVNPHNTKSSVFFNIVQTAFDPPPFRNFSENSSVLGGGGFPMRRVEEPFAWSTGEKPSKDLDL